MSTVTRRNQNWLPSIFNDLFDTDIVSGRISSANRTNIKESKDDYTVMVATPGISKEECNVHIEDDYLIIEAEHKSVGTDEKKEEIYLRHEFSITKYQQTLLLPEDVDREKIEAEVKHGVLTITLPKKKIVEEPKARKMIEIK